MRSVPRQFARRERCHLSAGTKCTHWAVQVSTVRPSSDVSNPGDIYWALMTQLKASISPICPSQELAGKKYSFTHRAQNQNRKSLSECLFVIICVVNQYTQYIFFNYALSAASVYGIAYLRNALTVHMFTDVHPGLDRKKFCLFSIKIQNKQTWIRVLNNNHGNLPQRFLKYPESKPLHMFHCFNPISSTDLVPIFPIFQKVGILLLVPYLIQFAFYILQQIL